MKYLAYYDTPSNQGENRNFSLAAANKIDYLCSVLNRIGQPVELISASRSCNPEGGQGKRIQISEQTSLQLFSSIGTGRLPKRLLGRMLFKIRLFLYLLLHIQKGETLLVYHSLGYAGMVTLLKKLRDFRLILEVEEIYADVSGRAKDRRKEFAVFSEADAYLFSTKLLHAKINTRKKPYVLIHGTYQSEPDRGDRLLAGDRQGEKAKKIHCVYAGTLDPRKGGAVAAAAAAQFLPGQYHIHILGFGSAERIQNMQTLVDRLAGSCDCGISYDGVLCGEDYIKFLQGCDIGLSTQNPEAAFNSSSFPSKILSYLGNGLQVVSIRTPAVEDSAIGAYLHYCDQQTPEAIARAILRVDLKAGFDGRVVIENLNDQFSEALEGLLRGNEL